MPAQGFCGLPSALAGPSLRPPRCPSASPGPSLCTRQTCIRCQTATRSPCALTTRACLMRTAREPPGGVKCAQLTRDRTARPGATRSPCNSMRVCCSRQLFLMRGVARRRSKHVHERVPPSGPTAQSERGSSEAESLQGRACASTSQAMIFPLTWGTPGRGKLYKLPTLRRPGGSKHKHIYQA